MIPGISSGKATRSALGLSVSLTALAAACPASAQVDEIVVTAQKVEQNIQDVPIAVTAVSGETLVIPHPKKDLGKVGPCHL